MYNNGGQSKKVAFEHEVLAQLAEQKLSFRTPTVRRTREGGAPYVKLSRRVGAEGGGCKGPECVRGPAAAGRALELAGRTSSARARARPRLTHPKRAPPPSPRPLRPNPSGDDACVFEIIPGTLAKTTSPREVGRATGELCRWVLCLCVC